MLHDPGVRLGSDPEDLHQLRVATRRLRAFLRAGRPLLEPSWSEPLRDELQWLGRALGPARDRDVMVERLREDVAALDDDAEALADLLAELEAEHAEARRAVVGALERSLPGAARATGSRVRAGAQRGGRPSCRRLARGVAPSTEDVRKARRRVGRRGAPRGPDQGEASPLRGGARGARARQAEQGLRRGREAPPGRARRAPGRDRGRGADPCVGRRPSRRRRRVTARRAGARAQGDAARLLALCVEGAEEGGEALT